MQQFPDKHSILVMDNCSIHHVQEVKDMIENAGILLLYLPPYSADYNPIEELFSYLKFYFKEHEDLIQTLSSPIRTALESIRNEKCNGWINYSKY